MADRPAPHPLAFPDSRSGAFTLEAGDRFIYDIDGRRGWADEFMADGDAFVTWDDGSWATIKWNHMSPEPKAEIASEATGGPYSAYVTGLADHWTCATCLSTQLRSQTCHCNVFPRLEMTAHAVVPFPPVEASPATNEAVAALSDFSAPDRLMTSVMSLAQEAVSRVEQLRHSLQRILDADDAGDGHAMIHALRDAREVLGVAPDAGE